VIAPEAAPAPPAPAPAAAAPEQPAEPKATPYTTASKKRVTSLAPLSSQRNTSSVPAAAPKPPAPETAPVPAPETAPAAAPAAVPELTPVDPKDDDPALVAAAPPAAPAVPAPAPAPAAAAPAPAAAAPAPAAETASGKYCVQLGAFSGPNRSQQAESLNSSVRKKHGLKSQIVKSGDDKVHRVVVSGFADKKSALDACAAIQKKPDLGGAFVREL